MYCTPTLAKHRSVPYSRVGYSATFVCPVVILVPRRLVVRTK